MPRYLITHPKGQQSEDVLIEDPDLTLTIQGGWAVLADTEGPCLVLPAHAGATITRVDEQLEGDPSGMQSAGSVE